MPGIIRGQDAERVAKMLKLKLPKKKSKKKKGGEWKPSPIDEAMAADLRKKFGIDTTK